MAVINLTQHNLTQDQISDLEKFYPGHDILNFKDFDPPMFEKLSQTPGNVDEIRNLAVEFFNWLEKKIVEKNIAAVILPIGSPAFIFALGMLYQSKIEEAYEKDEINKPILKPDILFSHSERTTIEETNSDGQVIKKSIFKHVKFLNLAHLVF